MYPRIEIKLDEIDFHILAMDTLNKCPSDVSENFSAGFYFYVCNFFEELDSTLIFFQIGNGIATYPLDLLLEEPLKRLPEEAEHLSPFQKKEFLLGVDMALELSSQVILLANSKAQNKDAA